MTLPKFKLETKMITYYDVFIEAESEEQAKEFIDDWIREDFEMYETGCEWQDGEFERMVEA